MMFEAVDSQGSRPQGLVAQHFYRTGPITYFLRPEYSCKLCLFAQALREYLLSNGLVHFDTQINCINTKLKVKIVTISVTQNDYYSTK